MRFDIITIFPKIFDSYFNESLIKRALFKKIIQIKIWNLRTFAKDKRKTVDDKPFGGGPGMVLKLEPIYKAINFIKNKNKNKKQRVI
ncbi:MAG: tRNA (guanosine(37)-N1)-methyltransferase TrmD, partial [Patescibacteria group bacterium]|nr:tRNA (guanosine(37)-N1)-methyltransferase TrmD [Patescibacteria group bacterium]